MASKTTTTTTKSKTMTMTTDRPDDNKNAQSSIYHWIMTPVNLITFIISLYLVDFHFHSQREHAHRHGEGSRLPGWLHRVLFKPQPYSWVGGGSPAPPNQGDTNWYYHSQQKRLMKMEASAAFEIRKGVMVGLMVLAVGVAWLFSRILVSIGGWYY